MIIDESNAHAYVDDYEMNISNKHITELRYVPPNITVLDCSHNELTTLPDLSNVKYLHCVNNKLTTLPNLSNLVGLYCWNNLFDVEYLEYLRLKYPNLRVV